MRKAQPETIWGDVFAKMVSLSKTRITQEPNSNTKTHPKRTNNDGESGRRSTRPAFLRASGIRCVAAVMLEMASRFNG